MGGSYFIAVVAPLPVADDILQFKTWMRDHYGCRVALRSPAHITLVAPFTADAGILESLHPLLEAFGEAHAPLEIELDGFARFDKRVIYLEVSPDPMLNNYYTTLHQQIRASIPQILKESHKPFHPHVTIANRDIPPGIFSEAYAHFEKISYRSQFRCEQLSLLELHPGKWEVIREYAFGKVL